MTPARLTYPPVFGTPWRWALRVLAWLAFGVSAYLAWHAVNHSSVAGCGIGGENSCNVVLSSSWSKWLGVPVAVLGLACYSLLAALSVVLEWRNDQLGRWVNTAFAALSALAACASLWFIALQVFAIGSYCVFCLITDVLGIAIGVIAVLCTTRWLLETRYLRKIRAPASGLMALRTALPTAARTTTAPGINTPRHTAPILPTPSLPVAVGGALAAIALLIGGQVLSPAKTYTVEEGTLDQSVAMVGSDDSNQKTDARPDETQRHVAMRVPPSENDDARNSQTTADATTLTNSNSEATDNSAAGNGANSAIDLPTNGSAELVPAEPKRLVEFLGGKLRLDVYKHPLIGSPEAPHVMIEMVSYDCPHCRKMHHIIKKGLARYGDQLAIIIMPIPFEKGCNKLIVNDTGSKPGACVTARLAIGIGEVRPPQFVKYHDWLMSGDEDKPPGVEKSLPKAYEMTGRDRLRAYIRGEEVNKQIAQYVDLYSKLRTVAGTRNEFGLPVQILGDKVMHGMVEKEEDIFKAWEEHLGVTPR
jgi:uncharacterized membrane protein